MERRLLIAAAALAALSIPSAPASAQRWSDADFGAAANVTVHRNSAVLVGNMSRHDVRSGHHRRHDGRRHHRDGDDALVAWGYDADFDINRSWDSDSFNDWWHDRPDRAFPRWVQNNQNCTADRMWWSGNGWHC